MMKDMNSVAVKMQKMLKRPVKKIKMTKKINKNMTFTELIEADPQATEKLMKAGMHCIGCPMAMMETIEQGCEAHGIDADELVKELNENKKNK